MNRIYDVKQAAKIIGVSTNTMYKYLNEGKISGIRGHERGFFRIPHRSLEQFIGSKITTSDVTEVVESTPTLFPLRRSSDEPAIIHVTPPSITTKVARSLILLTLVLIIADVLVSPGFSLNSQIIRIVLVSIFILITYQFGGFAKK